MPNLEVWNTTYSYRGDGVNRYMFPCLRILDIESCPKLRLEPCPPKAEDWIIRRSDGVISSSWGESVSHASASSSSSPLVTTLKIRNSEVPMHKWRLLCHLPALPHLEISDCSDLTSSPEILPEWLLGDRAALQKLTLDSSEVDTFQEVAKHLTSLQSLKLWCCKRMTTLPQWVGELVCLEQLSLLWCDDLYNLQEIMGCGTSLKRLYIEHCKGMESLPDSIQLLTKLEMLHIAACPGLERWYESEENKMKLAHIKEMKIVPVLF